MEEVKIRGPIHNYISLNKTEKLLMDSAEFQRLRNIRQLAAAYFVYPGAEHSRFSHSLGTFHVAKEILTFLSKSLDLKDEEIEMVRIASLLHDVGHGPFSHVFDEVISELKGINHEDVTVWFIRESSLNDILNSEGFSTKEITSLLEEPVDPSKKIFSLIVKGRIDADKLDYLVRDSYYTGVDYGRIDIARLASSLKPINLDLGVDYDSIHALEEFVIARYEMFKAVYYHRTVRSAELMLIKAIKLAKEFLGISDIYDAEAYVGFDDNFVTCKLRQIKRIKDPGLKTAAMFYENFEKRRLFKVAFEQLLPVRRGTIARYLSFEKSKGDIEREIAEKAGVDENFVIIDSPLLPSLPPRRKEDDPTEINVISTDLNGRKRISKFSDLSSLSGWLKEYLNVLRVYAPKKYKEVVWRASKEVLSERLGETTFT